MSVRSRIIEFLTVGSGVLFICSVSVMLYLPGSSMESVVIVFPALIASRFL